jgi:hypothetical protein
MVLFVRMKGLEPSRDYLPLEPESSASTNSATSAKSDAVLFGGCKYRNIFFIATKFYSNLPSIMHPFLPPFPSLPLGNLLLSAMLMGLFGGYSPLFSQQNLALENVSRLQRIVYMPGDYIRFQIQGENTVFEGRLESVNDSQLVIQKALQMENEGDASQRIFREYIKLHDVRFVYKRGAGSSGAVLRDVFAGGLVAGGLMYTVFLPLDAFTGQQQLNTTNFSIGLGMLAGGGLLKLFKKNKYRVGNKWRLKPMGPLLPADPPSGKQ